MGRKRIHSAKTQKGAAYRVSLSRAIRSRGGKVSANDHTTKELEKMYKQKVNKKYPKKNGTINW